MMCDMSVLEPLAASRMQPDIEVAITGLGLVTGFGLTPMDSWNGMLEGRSCMGAGGEFLRSGDPRRLRWFLAGSILDQALEGMSIVGPRLTTCAACSSGLNSLALAATLIRAGQIDAAVCGGYDSASEYAYAG